ncbi:MAG: hypothetical protein CL424_12950 [Acidimicrobiaceae bacterium]|nr:hypothetical protein [Acidimicrobiaceae bacterium]
MEGDYVLRLLDETRHEIDRSDAKASLMLAAVGAVGAILATSLLDPRSSFRTSGTFVTLFAAGAVGVLALSMVLLGVAVVPRVGNPTRGESRYFAEHAQFGSVDELRAALPTERADVVDRHVHQLIVLSKIVRGKYRRIRWAVGAAGLALGMATAAVVAAAI